MYKKGIKTNYYPLVLNDKFEKYINCKKIKVSTDRFLEPNI